MSDPSALIAGQVALYAALAVDEYRSGLRAKVEALPHEDGCYSIHSAHGDGECDCLIRDVLDLMRGSTTSE